MQGKSQDDVVSGSYEKIMRGFGEGNWLSRFRCCGKVGRDKGHRIQVVVPKPPSGLTICQNSEMLVYSWLEFIAAKGQRLKSAKRKFGAWIEVQEKLGTGLQMFFQGSHTNCLLFLAKVCDSVGEVWPMREVNLSLGVQVFIEGQACAFLSCLADLRYSDLSTQNKINHKSHCQHTLFNQTGTMWPKATLLSADYSQGIELISQEPAKGQS